VTQRETSVIDPELLIKKTQWFVSVSADVVRLINAYITMIIILGKSCEKICKYVNYYINMCDFPNI